MEHFEEDFQAFMAAGGFSQPCKLEYLEREQRSKVPVVSALCPHGKSKLRCEQCYFSSNKWKTND